VPITSLAVAHGLPAPNIKATVIGHGLRRTLIYRLNAEPGRQVTFAERGAHMYRVIGVARGARGRIGFAPAIGAGGRRDLVAQIVEGGIPTTPLVVAHYTAPGPARPGRPANLRVNRSGSTLTIRWDKARAAVEYEVAVLLVNGEQIVKLTRAHSEQLSGVPSDLKSTVTIFPIGAGMTAGTPARTTLAAMPKRLRPRRRSRHRH
jgi:hypothetical protein